MKKIEINDKNDQNLDINLINNFNDEVNENIDISSFSNEKLKN